MRRNKKVIVHVFSGVADNSSLACFCPEGYTGADQNPCLLMSAQAAVRKPVGAGGSTESPGSDSRAHCVVAADKSA